MKHAYLAYCILKEKYHQACVTGRNLKALGDMVRELEDELWPRQPPPPPPTNVRKDNKRACLHPA